MAHIQKLRRGTLSDEIVSDIRQKIASGEFGVGTKLPNEIALADAYGVGRGTVREAIKALTLMRLLERSTAGTFVASGAQIHAPDDLLMNIKTADPEFSSLYESRILLQLKVVELACQRATREDIAKINQAIEKAERATTNVASLEADLEYHHALAEAAHSPVVMYLYMVTTDAIARAYQTFLPLYQQDKWGTANHKLVAEAVEAKDTARAQRIAQASLERAAEAVRNIVRSQK
ncbi:FadR/GntR family transcriptional regulator [Janibacter melonis]|uniref:FadR/GntR family transcriptional regulator n=1 Tax=Janibacter melonis TaxID=262209 RepID=UPI001E5711F9|nr:FCD domain-containing protein [Janibacter melonis]MCB5991342.1 FCD domain-containing protein [Janibacter melonis]